MEVVQNLTRNSKGADRALRDHGPAGAAAVQVDLPALRARLVERLGEDFPPDRRFPDSGWTRMLADIQVAIEAGDATMAEGGP